MTSNSHTKSLVAVAQILGGAALVVAAPLLFVVLDRPSAPPSIAFSAPEAPRFPQTAFTPAAKVTVAPRKARAPVGLPEETESAEAASSEASPALAQAPPTDPLDTSGGIPRSAARAAPAQDGSSPTGDGQDSSPLSTTLPGQSRSPAADSQSGSVGVDAYLHWLAVAESERARLRAEGDVAALRRLASRRETAATPAEPAPEEGAPSGARDDSRAEEAVRSAVNSVHAFRQKIQRIKASVPMECMGVDRYYTSALDEECRATAALLEALGRGDGERVRALRRAGVSDVDRNLQTANLELEKLLRSRRLAASLRLQTGDDASLLGELTGPGGIR
jgi:hypothetical protein